MKIFLTGNLTFFLKSPTAGEAAERPIQIYTREGARENVQQFVKIFFI